MSMSVEECCRKLTLTVLAVGGERAVLKVSSGDLDEVSRPLETCDDMMRGGGSVITQSVDEQREAITYKSGQQEAGTRGTLGEGI